MVDYFTKTVREGENMSLGIGLFYKIIPECNPGSDITLSDVIYAEKYNSKKVQTDFLVEDTVIEKKSDIEINATLEEYLVTEDIFPGDLELFQKDRFYTLGPHVVAGIPTERFNWIMKNVSKLHGRKVICEGSYTNENYLWINAYLLPEVTRKEYLDCQVFKPELKRTSSIGTVTEMLQTFKSNLTGFGQFTLIVQPQSQLVFFYNKISID